MNNALIYGKDETQNVVCIEVENAVATLFIETENGITTQTMEAPYWATFDGKPSEDCIPLKGDLDFRYAKKYNDYKEFRKDVYEMKFRKQIDAYVAWNVKEQFMIRTGVTYFKGMNPKQVSVLSFDIETTSLTPSDNDKVLLISNTFRNTKGEVERRLFSYDEYKSTKEMIYAWAHWVKSKDPSIICGHNIISFDLPYLSFYVETLPIARNSSGAFIAERPSEFRKEGGQTYTYNNITIYGREIVDTFHLSIKYDAASRKYESYKLKSIIDAEGLTRPNRQFYDASTIRTNYRNPVEWEKIKEYCVDDGDDALKLFDLMIPSYFYFNRAIPKSLQQIINGASGAQINSWMVRAYIQEGHSLPRPSESEEFVGAISFGNAGIYQNVKKVDVASLYPSIILQYEVYDKAKDPKGYFLQMVQHFTKERLENKRLAKETGETKYKDLEQSQKIIINSAYGFLGAGGLNFNSPAKAAFITRKGRDILEAGMKWATDRYYQVINGDTDSFCYIGGNDFKAEIADLNSKFPELIKWEDDGQFDSVVILKAKNYALRQGDKIKIKGSGLKAANKEPVLLKFIDHTLGHMLNGRLNSILQDYERGVKSVSRIDKSNIKDWCSKKTVTKSVLNPERTNESRVLDAIKGKGLVEGDKVYMFFETPTTLRCAEDFTGVYDKPTMYKKLYNTIKIFDTVLDMSQFLNYSLKKNLKLIDTNGPELMRENTTSQAQTSLFQN